MKKILWILIGVQFISIQVKGQEGKVIEFTSDEVEAIFLEHNLELIAEKMNIPIAEAFLAQVKLWDNPNVSISNLNLWSTNKQREGEAEVIPPLFGSFGKNMEFSVELSQLIQTANKRGKLVRMEKVSKEMTIRQFEEFLRGLRAELRKTIAELVYLDAYFQVLNEESGSFSRLISTYERQVADGNVSRMELLRLQSALFDIENEKNEVEVERNAQQRVLKVLLCLEPDITIRIKPSDQKIFSPQQLSLSELIQTATDSRPDLKLQELETQYHEKSLVYERSQRVPDITLSVGYDRYGGVWKDFIGFGVNIDLPLFNRNQGNINMARISREQSMYRTQQHHNRVHNEIAEALNSYVLLYDFYRKIDENPLLHELDAMLDVYARNFLNRNISMLEYIDFMNTYRNNKQTWLNARKNLSVQCEELRYAVGELEIEN